MIFDMLQRKLSRDELSAIRLLEKGGFVVMTEVLVQDGKVKDKKPVRTFSRSGRYDLMIGIKSISMRPEAFVSTGEIKQRRGPKVKKANGAK